jgi:hypothetical protein
MTTNQIEEISQQVWVYQMFWRFINGFNDGQQDFNFVNALMDNQTADR